MTVRELTQLKYDFSSSSARRKRELLTELARARLSSPRAVRDLHEALCFIRAFPQDAALLEIAEGILGSFHERRDLRKFRKELEDSGIAGTDITFRFYWLTAIWLQRMGWTKHLEVHWADFEKKKRLDELWHLLVPYCETPGLDAHAFTTRRWLHELKSPEESEGEFLVRRFETLKVPVPVREKIYEDLDIPMILTPGPDTPARGRERWAPSPVVFSSSPPPAGRPRLRDAVRSIRIRVRPVSETDGRKLIDLANRCMVPRHRDLLIFLNADPKSVRMVDCGDGLQFACYGAVPERRLLLESVHGFLTLKNGVPIGYVLCSALFQSAEVAYNVFETFRGRGAAHVYAHVLAMVHRLFGVDTFAIDPYQLGHNNAEGLSSGAWWFYYKLGFRPHDPWIRELVAEERARLQAQPGYRTPRARLNELASEYMFLHLDRPRKDVLGHISLGNIGLGISRYLAARFGADRERGLRVCVREARTLLGVRRGSRTGSAWERWAPLVMALPGVDRWTPDQKRSLAAIIEAKGGPTESDFVKLFDGHARLRTALLAMAEDDD